MSKPSNRIAATATSIALVGAFGAGAFALGHEGNSFDPEAFASAYQAGSTNSEKGYQANPTQTDAQANRQESNGEDQAEKTIDHIPSDAFSELPLEGQSGTTAYNVTGNSNLSGVDVFDAAAGTSGTSTGSNGTPVVGPVVNPDANADTNGNNSGSDKDSTPSDDKPNSGGDSDNDPDPAPADNDSYHYLPSDPEASKSDMNDGTFTFKDVGADDVSLDGIDESRFEVTISESLNADDALYYNQRIDAWTLFCSLNTVFYDTGAGGFWPAGYQWICTKSEFPSYSYFRIDSWQNAETGEENPSVCPESTLNINYSYRFTADGEWHSGTYAYEPKESCVFVVGEPDENGNRPVLYRSTDSTVNLLSSDTLGKVLRAGGYVGENDTLSALLLGWKEGTEDVGWRYQVEPGRHVIMPGKISPLTSGYTARLQHYLLNENLEVTPNGTSSLLQTLVDVDDSVVSVGADKTETLTVPYGIQAIDNDKGSSTTSCYLYAVNNLVIPSSVLYVNTEGPIKVWSNYQVMGSNPFYGSTADGILTSRDGTEYLGLPLSATELTVPKGVKRVAVPSENYLEKIRVHATSGNLPQIDIDKLSDCTIVIDDEAFDEFVAQNGDAIENAFGVSVCRASDQDVSYYCSGGMVYTEDELLRVFDNGSDTAFVQLPHTIKAGCFQGNTTIKTLVLFDDSDFAIEDGALAGGSLETIVCFTDEQAEYLKSRLKAAGAPDADVVVAQFSQESFAYYSHNGATTLLSDQGFAKRFDGTLTTESGETLDVNVISPYAFAGDTDLAWVTLSDSITSVGANAFKNCTGLQGLFIGKTSNVSFGANFLENCTSLGFVGSNALEASFATSENPNSTCKWFCTEAGGASHDSRFEWFSTSIVEGLSTFTQDDGSLTLYGCDDQGAPWLCLGGGTSFSGTLKAPDSLVEVYEGAFKGMQGSFDIDFSNAAGLEYIDKEAFSDSGLTGDVSISTLQDLELGNSVFEGCGGLTSISLAAGGSLSLGNNVFTDCAELESASFTGAASGRIGTELFYSCDKLQSLVFNEEPPTATLYSPGTGFRFNGDWAEGEEAQTLHISVPEGQEQAYLEAWVYPFIGYANYDDYYNKIDDELFNQTYEVPTEAQVRAVMAENLLEPENRLRQMMGLPQVESSTILSDESMEVDGFTYSVNDLGATLTSAPADAVDIDLSQVLPRDADGQPYAEGVAIAADAFAQCSQLKSVTLCEAIDRIESGAFNGCDGVTVTLPQGCGLPQLSGGSDSAPFTFGADIKLNVSEEDQDTVLETWPMQCLGYEDVDSFEFNAADVFFSLFDFDAFEPPTREQTDEAINGPLVEQENYLRGLMGLEPITSTSELAYSYDLSALGDWWSDDDPFAFSLDADEPGQEATEQQGASEAASGSSTADGQGQSGAGSSDSGGSNAASSTSSDGDSSASASSGTGADSASSGASGTEPSPAADSTNKAAGGTSSSK